MIKGIDAESEQSRKLGFPENDAAELRRKIIESRPDAAHIDCDFSDSNRLLDNSRAIYTKFFGFAANAASYVALFVWSMISPEGFGSLLYLSYLIGDVTGKFVFGHWGYEKEIFKPDIKGFASQIMGFVFFLVLIFTDNAFKGALDFVAASVALLAILSAAIMFLKIGILALAEMPRS